MSSCTGVLSLGCGPGLSGVVPVCTCVSGEEVSGLMAASSPPLVEEAAADLDLAGLVVDAAAADLDHFAGLPRALQTPSANRFGGSLFRTGGIFRPGTRLLKAYAYHWTSEFQL